jgi:hypothetical protein
LLLFLGFSDDVVGMADHECPNVLRDDTILVELLVFLKLDHALLGLIAEPTINLKGCMLLYDGERFLFGLCTL